ncbi:MAG: saccharopine dehydrogenase, partial [Actinobacteria bacterium]|nr:saccharopine dehydrogenase [Actinomycetota bacterium]
CAEAGTDYVDLTGEPEFVDLMYVKYNATAEKSGARLIHACGFDSIPHDLGAQFTVEQLPEGVPLTVRGYVTANGTFSGGTAASALEAMSRMSESKKAHTARVAAEPLPAGRTAKVVAGKPGKSRDTGRWSLPMPTIDPEIVLNSARRVDRFGPDFSYSHNLDSKSFIGTASMVVGIGFIAGMAQVGPVRRWMSNRVPPGTGPSEEKRAASWFKVRFFGEGGGVKVVTEVAGGDPGYGETAKMISESALCLAFDDLPTTSGQQTTASAMGSALRTRLITKGITFTVIPA